MEVGWSSFCFFLYLVVGLVRRKLVVSLKPLLLFGFVLLALGLYLLLIGAQHVILYVWILLPKTVRPPEFRQNVFRLPQVSHRT